MTQSWSIVKLQFSLFRHCFKFDYIVYSIVGINAKEFCEALQSLLYHILGEHAAAEETYRQEVSYFSFIA